MNLILAGLVRLFHMFVVCFILFIPFMKVPWLVNLLHTVSVMSLLLHWYLDQDVCVLTILESALSGVRLSESFMYKLVSPIYRIRDSDLKKIVWVVTPVLGMITLKKLYDDYVHGNVQFFTAQVIKGIFPTVRDHGYHHGYNYIEPEPYRR